MAGEVVDLFTKQVISTAAKAGNVSARTVQVAQSYFLAGQLPVACPFCDEGLAMAKPTKSRSGYPYVKCGRCGTWAHYPGELGQEKLWRRALETVQAMLEEGAAQAPAQTPAVVAGGER